jgi:membrane associated rhomboid family serine protease
MCLYVIMSGISIVINRRAFMVSSLIYVIYAISSLIENYGGVGYSFAITGVFMGIALLLLSAFWKQLRQSLVSKLPLFVREHVPSVSP